MPGPACPRISTRPQRAPASHGDPWRNGQPRGSIVRRPPPDPLEALSPTGPWRIHPPLPLVHKARVRKPRVRKWRGPPRVPKEPGPEQAVLPQLADPLELVDQQVTPRRRGMPHNHTAVLRAGTSTNRLTPSG